MHEAAPSDKYGGVSTISHLEINVDIFHTSCQVHIGTSSTFLVFFNYLCGIHQNSFLQTNYPLEMDRES